MILPGTKEINEFWSWFLSAAEKTNNVFIDQSFITTLDMKLSDFGGISWELGPGFTDPRKSALVLSPSGDKELLRLTKAMVSLAPNRNDWEFYPAKPPKRWEKRFTLETNTGTGLSIDASSWHYALYRFPDDTFKIVISAPELCKLTELLKFTAAEIVLDGELGEEARIKWMSEIEILEDSDNCDVDCEHSIGSLRNHIAALTSQEK